MARVTPTTEPTILVAGDSWSWTKSLGTYPPSEGWTLGYSFRGASTLADVDVVVSVVNGQYSVSVLPAKTAALAAGAYQWASYVTGSGAYAGQKYTVDTGILTVLPALSALSGSQGQSHAERTLVILEAAIEGRLTKDYENYSIMGRAISKIPIEKLIRFRSIYAEKVRRLNNPGQMSTPVLALMSQPDGDVGSAAPVVLPAWYRSLNS